MSADYIISLNRLIDKATDSTLLEDNLAYILDVCDKVNSNPESGSSAVIDALTNKLNSRDGNVQLRTLSLLTSVAENCGSRVQQLVATKSFTGLLINKLTSTSVHKEIKTKIVQVMEQLSNSFKGDPSLKPMQDAFKDVKLTYPHYFPPEKPSKQPIRSDYDEEQLLQQVMKASLEEYEQQSKLTAPTPPQPRQQQQQQQPAPRTFSRVRALYDSTSNDPEDLQFRKGDIITVLDKEYADWCKGSLRGVIGLFPFNYVTPLYDPTPQELAKEAEKEASVLTKSRDIETLLSILTQASNSNDPLKYQALDDDRFKRLYQEVIGIKPELAVLIDKYSQRQSDLTDLHKRLKEAGTIYEDLNDPSKFPHPQQQPSYQPSYHPQQQQYNNYQTPAVNYHSSPPQSQQQTPYPPIQPQYSGAPLSPQATPSYPPQQQTKQQYPAQPQTSYQDPNALSYPPPPPQIPFNGYHPTLASGNQQQSTGGSTSAPYPQS